MWNPWWNEGPVWIGQSMGKILEEHLKDRGLFTMNNLSTTFRIPKGRVLQEKDLFYKEKTWATRKRLGLQGKEARPHYYKSPNTPSHQSTHNWPLSSTLELWEYFWLNLRRVFGRLHTGAFCKVFLFSSRVQVTLERTDRASHWWKLQHHQSYYHMGIFILLLNMLENTYIR